ncbi:TRAP-type C4-dicarboxylate transport system, small permease component [Tritonibacter multivorans]|uniref:TRAP transporter small permease protein n=1 Tax=Tritonibacter multivorans TaxID=928856 RepID=A0A0P1GRB0_9RHOB|nr:TRAP transporter small permease [Tritonibacter multivorans]MDA7422285.1 TRAP transporter small permease [Tritonibacter multivorans]CUH77766.1 TRAP-type C4-dicarboxylate transport system, small permease component [Tritonibacter multivorans]SFD12156.1 TRAP-type C4-dicarboxylate transport system, small permease component [Tritonibacter multivorans]
MKALMAVVTLLYWVNGTLLRIGRWIGVVAVAAMVVAILVQVFFRYVLNNALPWPDEAARFCMLWMTGLMAPTAFRQGGFAAIDTVTAALPKRAFSVLMLFLLAVSLTVLTVGVQIGYKEVTGIGGRFATASLYVPTSFGFDDWYRVPRSWMMWSLLVGIALLILVNIELILHRIVSLLGGDDALPSLDAAEVGGAE